MKVNIEPLEAFIAATAFATFFVLSLYLWMPFEK
jgi:hypothetical protein